MRGGGLPVGACPSAGGGSVPLDLGGLPPKNPHDRMRRDLRGYRPLNYASSMHTSCKTGLVFIPHECSISSLAKIFDIRRKLDTLVHIEVRYLYWSTHVGGGVNYGNRCTCYRAL